MQKLGREFAQYLIGPEKEKFLSDLKKIKSLEKYLPLLERKVEFLATGNFDLEFSKHEKTDEVLDYYQKLIQIYPNEPSMKRVYSSACIIIAEQEDKKKALKALNGIRDIIIGFIKDSQHIIFSQADKFQRMRK